MGVAYVCTSVKLPTNQMFLIGTILLIVGYALMAIHYYKKINIVDEKYIEHEENLFKNKYIIIGAVILFLFYVLSHIIKITPHVSGYDMFGVIGYVLMALKYAGNEDKQIFCSADLSLSVYYLLSIMKHYKVTNACECMQLMGKVLLLIYYGHGVIVCVKK